MDLAINTFSILYGLFGLAIALYCDSKYNNPTNLEALACGYTNSTGPK